MLTNEMSYTRASRADGYEKIDKATRQKMVLECLERGEMTANEALVGGVIRDICYNNSIRYFGV